MPSLDLPSINMLVDLALVDGSSYPSRVEDVDRDLFTVAAPYGVPASQRPTVGALLELAWLNENSRIVAPVKLVDNVHGAPTQLGQALARPTTDTALTRPPVDTALTRPPLWLVRVVAEARRQSRRAFVRGGGGEEVVLTRLTADATPVTGRVVDISEGGIRCRVIDGGFAADQLVDIALVLDDGSIQLTGRVLFARWNRETADHDLVVHYETDEPAGRLIRGYVLRQQIERRRRFG